MKQIKQKSMKKTTLAVFISASLSSGAAFAGIPAPGVVTVDTTGVGHSQFITQDGTDLGSGHIDQSGTGGHTATIDQGPAQATITADIHQDGDDASHTATIFQYAGATGASVATIYQSGAGNIAGIDTTGDGGLTILQGQNHAGTSFGNDATIATTGVNTLTMVDIEQDGVMNEAAVTVGSSDGATINVKQSGAAPGTALNKATVDVATSDGAKVDVTQATGARNEATVDVDDNSGTVDVDVIQKNESNISRSIVKRNTNSTKSSITQDGTDNEATSRLTDNYGGQSKVTLKQNALSSGNNLGRGIIERSEASTAEVTQDGIDGEANVIIYDSAVVKGKILQGDSNDVGSYANIVFSEGSAGSNALVDQTGDGQSAAVTMKTDAGSDILVTQTGEESSATVKVNNSSLAIVGITQAGQSQSVLAKVRGGSVNTSVDVEQGVYSGKGRDNRATVSVRADTSGVVFVEQGLSDNTANVVLDTTSTVGAYLGQLGNDNDAEVFIQNAVGSFVSTQQFGTGNVAFTNINDDINSWGSIYQEGDLNDAIVKSEGGITNMLSIEQIGNENVASAEANLATSGVTIDIDQVDNGNTATALLDTVDGGTVVIDQSGGDQVADVSHMEFSDDAETNVTQSGRGNTAMVTLDESKDGKIDIVQTGQDGIVDLSLVDSDEITTFKVNQGGVMNSVIGSLNQSDVDNITINQTNVASNNNSVVFDLDESDGLSLITTQIGDYNQATFNIAESDDSSLNVNQSNGGIGHIAMVTFDDADDSTFVIDQDGFDNEANVLLSDVNSVTGNLVQGGYGNLMDVTITTNGDNFDSTILAIDQSTCFECTAVYSN